MEVRERSSIEEVLLARIALDLTSRGVNGFDRGAVHERILDVLADQNVDTLKEQPSGALSPGEARSTAARARELASRLERALISASELAFRQVGLRPPISWPSVAVVGETQSSNAESVRRVIAEALAGSGPPAPLPASLGGHGRSALALVFGTSIDSMRSTFCATRILERPVFVEAHGATLMEREALQGVHIVAFACALGEATEALEQILSGRRRQISRRTRDAAGKDTLVGKNLDGKFEVLRRIGRGTFGSVYEARDTRLGNRVAIKVLHPDENCPPEDFIAFKNEARRLTRLSHPHIVDWKTFEETADGTSYLVMELLEGEELEHVLRRERRIEPRRAAKILLQIADALRTAHFLPNGQSILHLDLKPGNVFVLPEREGATDRIKVIDFGIGQHVSEAHPPAPSDREVAGVGTVRSRRSIDEIGTVPRIQRSGACTPEYAAPEQCAHMLSGVPIVPLDGRADLYALGAIAFRMVTGTLPFEPSGDRQELMRTKLECDAPRVASSGVRLPRAFAAWIDRCLERERDLRFRDLREAHDALARIVSPPLWKRAAIPSAIALTLAAVALWRLWPDPARNGLDLWTEIDGAEKSLLGSRLYLGPARSVARLRVIGLPPESSSPPRPSLRVVDGKGESAHDVAGWNARWVDDDAIELRGDPGTDRRASAAYISIHPKTAEAMYTIPLELVWLGTDAWQLVDAGIDDLRGRALDPAGQTLRIRMHGTGGDLAWVGVNLDGKHTECSSSAIRDDESVYSLGLDLIGLRSGERALAVEAKDRSGRIARLSVALDVRTEPLRIESAELDGVRSGDRTLIGPRSNLHLALGGRADAAWTVRDASGRALASGAKHRIERADITLPDLQSVCGDRAISGFVEVVCGDDAYVARANAPARGRALARLPFTFDPMPPEFDLRIVDPNTSDAQLVGAAPMFVSTDRVTMRVVRKNVAPMQLTLEAHPIANASIVCAKAVGSLVDAARSAEDLVLDLPSEGSYRVVARAIRPDSQASSDAVSQATAQATIVVEPHAPVLALETTSGVLLHSTDAAPPTCRITVSRAGCSAADADPPVALDWTLARDARPDDVVARGAIVEPLTRANPVDWTLPLPWAAEKPTRANSLDGEWRIRVSGRDAGGHTAEPEETSFRVALDGPDLELVRPAPATVWPRNPSGRFEIEVLARDPNSIADVDCRVRRRGTDDVLRVELKRGAEVDGNVASFWKGEIALPPTWSRADVQLDISGIDGEGTRSRMLEGCTLPGIEVVLPPRIEVDVAGHPSTPMRLVRGNADREYVFGGRIDEEEATSFREAGLGVYNPFRTPRSWQSICAPGEVTDYYLDEREVSNAEMLAFVSALDGWPNERFWAHGAAPTSTRRDELATSLSASEPDQAAAGVTWDEANAYARWAGKRLQSLLEWEYALRGGVQYRAWSGWTAGSRARSDESELDGARTKPAGGRSDLLLDVTTDTGIAHLSDNVSEWTSTAVGMEKRKPPAPDRSGAASLPGAGRELYWVAGGSFELPRLDFATLDRRERNWSSHSVGFRCAMSASELSRSGDPATERSRFRAAPAPESLAHSRDRRGGD